MSRCGSVIYIDFVYLVAEDSDFGRQRIQRQNV